MAREAYQALSAAAPDGASLRLGITDSDQEVVIELTPGMREFLLYALANMAAGNGLTIVPLGAELTTVQAADILNVSRPYVIRLINEGKIPCIMVGTHRRLKYEDVMKYKEKSRKMSDALLDELGALTQEMTQR